MVFNSEQRVDGGSYAIDAQALDPLGCLGRGWYCIRFGMAAFKASPRMCGRASGRRRTAECLRTWIATFLSHEATRNALCSARGSSRSIAPSIIICARLSRQRRSDGRIFRMDDFVIPRREEVCEYIIEDVPERPQLSHYDTVVRGVKTTVPVFDCCSGGRDVGQLRGTGGVQERTGYYDTQMRTAHLVMDALQESGAQGGAWVEVKVHTPVCAISSTPLAPREAQLSAVPRARARSPASTRLS